MNDVFSYTSFEKKITDYWQASRRVSYRESYKKFSMQCIPVNAEST